MVRVDEAFTPERWPGPSRFQRARFHAVRWAPLFLVAIATFVVFPPPASVSLPELAVGDVAARQVTAPFGYVVRKSPDDIAREGESRAALVQPVYRYSATGYDSALTAVRAYFTRLDRADSGGMYAVRNAAAQLPARLDGPEIDYLADPMRRRQVREVLLDFLAEKLARGVADAGVVRGEQSQFVVLRRGDAERLVPRDSIASFADLMEQAEGVVLPARGEVADRVFRRLVGAFFRPTVVLDQSETAARRERLRSGVDSVRFRVRAGETVVAAGEPVTEEKRVKLAALAEELQRRSEAASGLRTTAGAILYNALILSAFWLLLLFYRQASYASLREAWFFGGLFTLLVLMTAGVHEIFPGRPELVPIAFAAVIITMLYNGRIGVFAAITLAILLGEQWALRESHTLFFGVVGGVAGAVGIRAVRRRRHLYRTIAVLAAGYALAALAMGLTYGWTAAVIVDSALLGALVALASASVAMIVLPLAESVTGVTTDLTLLELSDLGRPLLRRLAVEAPGTWAHSLAMANLCESACNLIGANGLLARVGCYYHDVGKLANPQYFIENQGGGPNPHDRLEPNESALIIRDHVRDGLALAEAAKLPKVVRDFIPEHHGTSEINYFLARARRRGAGLVDLRDFRYPGPRPQSAETAVAMLADSAEAAIRVLRDPTGQAVAEAIEQLVEQKLASGQLDDAPMTLRDLDLVKREFARVMSGTYHKRIVYPRMTGGPVPELESARNE